MLDTILVGALQRLQGAKERENLFNGDQGGLVSKKRSQRQLKLVSTAIAYSAALQAATAALAAAGYRAYRDNHHYRVIQSLEFTVAPGLKIIDTFDGFRRSEMSAAMILPERSRIGRPAEMLTLAKELRKQVEGRIRATRPELLWAAPFWTDFGGFFVSFWLDCDCRAGRHFAWECLDMMTP